MRELVIMNARCYNTEDHTGWCFTFLVDKMDTYHLMFHTVKELGKRGYDDINVDYMNCPFEANKDTLVHTKEDIDRTIADCIGLVKGDVLTRELKAPKDGE